MLELALKGDRREYTPGEAIEGVVRWSDEKTPRGLTVSLVYRTEGRGTQDSATVAEESLAPNGGPGEVPFSVKAPEAPYTFDGSLISLRWYVVAASRQETVEATITVSPWLARVTACCGTSSSGCLSAANSAAAATGCCTAG